MDVIIKIINYLFYRNNIQVEPKEKFISSIIENIYNMRCISIENVKKFKNLSTNSLLELVYAFNKSQNHLIHILEYDLEKDKKID